MVDSKLKREIQNIILEVNNINTDKLSVLAETSNLNLLSDFSGVDLSSEDLSDDNLANINLSGTNLRNANLSNTNLNNADLSNANLRGANLSNANLNNADLSNANLRGANLSNANLSDANLNNANLRGANLDKVNLNGAFLKNSQIGSNIGITEEIIQQFKQGGAGVLYQSNAVKDESNPEKSISSNEITSNLLEELQSSRNRLIRLNTIEEVIEVALGIVRRKLHSQTSAIYLFSKDGRLHRMGIKGVDLNGNPIDSKWLSSESYAVGESFIGRAAYPQKDGYGKPQIPDNLLEDFSQTDIKNHYLQKIGSLNCGIAVPLDGQSKTYGVLAVLNKVDQVTERILPIRNFPSEEVHWLSAVGSSVATAISYLRRSRQNELEADLGQLLIETPYDNINVNNTYSEIVTRLTSENTAFNACILRLQKGHNILEEKARGGIEIDWNNRSAEVVELDASSQNTDASSQNTLAIHKIVCEQRKPFIFERISSSNRYLFSPNDKWMKDNKFKSYGLFPLVYKEEVLGTLSLYTAYEYDFHPSCKRFLSRITTLIAAFVRRVDESKIIGEIDQSLSGINPQNCISRVENLQTNVRKLMR